MSNTKQTSDPGQNSPPAEFDSHQIEDELHVVEGSLDRIEGEIKESGSRGNARLAWLLFIATFLGTSLGIVAELADASGLIIPVLELVNPAPEIRIVGSNTVLADELGMAEVWKEEFQAREQWTVNVPLAGDITRTVGVGINPIGTVNGIENAIGGNKIDVLTASEPLTRQQIEQLEGAGVTIQCATEVGYDVVAFVTDFSNTAPLISNQDMSKIMIGETLDWFAVGGDPQRIRILARPGSGTTEVILNNYTGSTEWQDHFIPCGEEGGNQACLDLTLRIPGSLYWVSSAWMRTQPTQYLAVVPTRGRSGSDEAPSPIEEAFDPNAYPRELIRPLYMYVLSGGAMDAESTDVAKRFLRYVRSVHGQETLENHFFYTFFDPPGAPGEIPLDLPAPFDEPNADGLRPDCLE